MRSRIDVKATFYCFLGEKEENMFAVARWCDNKYEGFLPALRLENEAKFSKQKYRSLFKTPEQNCMRDLECF